MSNSTDYKTEFIQHKDYLEILNSGVVNGAMQMMQYSGASLQKAIELGFKKVLVDESKMEITLSDMDQHELMNSFLNNFPKSLDIKFSVIYNIDKEEGALFFDDLSKRVGFDCTFFRSREEAIQHLIG
jgi:hypothetical protein